MMGSLGAPTGTGLELTLQPPPPPHTLTRTAKTPNPYRLLPPASLDRSWRERRLGQGQGGCLMTLRGPNLRLAAAEWLRLAPGGG